MPTICIVFYYLIATAWSVFQYYAGRTYGLFIIDSTDHKLKISSTKEILWLGASSRDRKWAYGFQHGAFYFICTFSGFVSLNIAYLMWCENYNWENLSTVFVLLCIYSVVGISGGLPRILFLGKWPG
ncbi:MAG: hypothetical protein L0Y80_02305 [Ignavibacteriae bacterium]|nr:hypothetical protein [Ignavibacteriota bacterium]